MSKSGFIGRINSKGRCYILRSHSGYTVIFTPSGRYCERITATCQDEQSARRLMGVYMSEATAMSEQG